MSQYTTLSFQETTSGDNLRQYFTSRDVTSSLRWGVQRENPAAFSFAAEFLIEHKTTGHEPCSLPQTVLATRC